MKRALPQAPDGPRFRIARVVIVAGKEVLSVFGEEDGPADAMRRVFNEDGRVLAVDRRGYIYADNHKAVTP